MKNILPTSNQALTYSPKDRRAWLQQARTILETEGDTISHRPYSDRASLAAASDDFWRERLNILGQRPYNWQQIKQIVDRRIDLHSHIERDLELQILAQRHLTIPRDYFSFIADVHAKAYWAASNSKIWKDVISKWMKLRKEQQKNDKNSWAFNLPRILWEYAPPSNLRKNLDAHGITIEKVLALQTEIGCQCAVAAQEVVFARTGHLAKMSPIKAMGVPKGLENAIGRENSPTGLNDNIVYYSNDKVMYDANFLSLMDKAFHESQHAIDQQICDLNSLHHGSVPLFLSASSFLLNLYDIWSGPQEVFSATRKMKTLSQIAYATRPREKTAHFHGMMAEIVFSKDSGANLTSLTSKRLYGYHRELVELFPTYIKESYYRSRLAAPRFDL